MIEERREEGPFLEKMTHRLSECPPEFLMDPVINSEGMIHADAVVLDLLRTLSGNFFPLFTPCPFQSRNDGERNRLQLILVASWLLYDDWFLERSDLAEKIHRLLSKELDELATVVDAEQCVIDPDRREELARYCLHKLDLRPEGETEIHAQDRLTTLDSIERARIMNEALKAEKWREEVLGALKKKEEAVKIARE
ncbi:MAG: hypothetical protein ACMUIP_13610 [bacterium]